MKERKSDFILSCFLIVPWIRGLILALTLVGCGSSETKPPNVYRSAEEDRPLVDSKYSLSADRKALEELRSQVPEEKKQANDELAFVLQLVSESQPESTRAFQKSPAQLRSQFDSVLRKKREQFNKDLREEREKVTKEERKKREIFLKSQQEAREVFARQKKTRDEKNDFYKELDEKRTDYFSKERERRADFESDMRERRKSFEDYTREKTNEFNQEIRAYQKRYEENKKRREQLPKTGDRDFSAEPFAPADSDAAQLERELQEARLKAGTPLESGE